MPVYMADCFLPGITADELVAFQWAAVRMSEQYTLKGTPVHYLRSTFLPGESRCLCLFEADSAKLVQEVNEAAGIPFTRIIEALELIPPPGLNPIEREPRSEG